ncbi:MAG: nitroreductase family protein [Gammaproteobacteria bacterium]|nr:nitroreductase family protein [Gammaproteobacteria bacterium]
MNLFDAIQQRRAVKTFDAACKIPEQDVKKILSMARLSPTAYNQQNYRFVIIQDPGIREKIKTAAHGQAQVSDASLLIVLCADTKAWEKNTEQYWSNTTADLQKAKLQAMQQYYLNREQAQRDEAMRSCALAAQNMMLTAKAMHYDSCPMIGFDFDAVAKLIQLPADHVISMMLAIGKASQAALPRFPQLADEQLIFFDSF